MKFVTIKSIEEIKKGDLFFYGRNPHFNKVEVYFESYDTQGNIEELKKRFDFGFIPDSIVIHVSFIPSDSLFEIFNDNDIISQCVHKIIVT